MELDNNAQMPTPEAAPAPQEAGELVKCPCCGKMTLHKPVKPGQDIMDHFMACMLTGTPYKQTYELYGGRMRVTVTQITNDIRRYVMDACAALDSWRDLLVDRNTELEEMKDALRTYSCIVDVTVDNGTVRTFYPGEGMHELCTEITALREAVNGGKVTPDELRASVDKLNAKTKDPATISSLPPTMLMASFQLHNQLFQIMMDAGFDENFWDRIKLE